MLDSLLHFGGFLKIWTRRTIGSSTKTTDPVLVSALLLGGQLNGVKHTVDSVFYSYVQVKLEP